MTLVPPIGGFFLSALNHPDAKVQRTEFKQQIAHHDSPYGDAVKFANDGLLAAKVPLSPIAGGAMKSAMDAIAEKRMSNTTAATFAETAGFMHSAGNAAWNLDVRGLAAATLGVIATPLRGIAVHLHAAEIPGTPEHDYYKSGRHLNE
ncbi:hypothetical protein WM40_24415 [Robbsia andropogonis]|uniref:Uncharacterized protein n=2 Tax=Robbsia andropogonis TaxID=28092 RepID=A0A0F5JUD1_9BURK|nr:hypothetical protein WM40_24415 [Robbsia andropogonis]